MITSMNTSTMKKRIYTTAFPTLMASLATLILLVQLAACGGGGDPAPTPSAQDGVKAKLTSGKWNMQTAQVDGVDKTATYSGLSVTFSASGYTTTNGKGLWPALGGWSFVDTEGKKIKREDGTEMTVEVTDTSLKLSFNWTKATIGGGRAESLPGQHVLSFTK